MQQHNSHSNWSSHFHTVKGSDITQPEDRRKLRSLTPRLEREAKAMAMAMAKATATATATTTA